MTFFNRGDLVSRQEHTHDYRLVVVEDGIRFLDEDGYEFLLIPFSDKWLQTADFRITQHIEFVNGNYNRVGMTFHQDGTDPAYDD
jgi:hypothetical protein